MNYKVIIPEESFVGVRFEQDGLVGDATINKSLIGFKPRVVFQWHLSVMLHLETVGKNDSFLSDKAQDLIDDFEEQLDAEFKGKSNLKPDALFLARIDWNDTIELIWRTVSPDHPNDYLSSLLEEKKYPAPFDYKISPDPEWNLAKWHLDIIS
jgi:hypothetical protein